MKCCLSANRRATPFPRRRPPREPRGQSCYFIDWRPVSKPPDKEKTRSGTPKKMHLEASGLKVPVFDVSVPVQLRENSFLCSSFLCLDSRSRSTPRSRVLRRTSCLYWRLTTLTSAQYVSILQSSWSLPKFRRLRRSCNVLAVSYRSHVELRKKKIHKFNIQSESSLSRVLSRSRLRVKSRQDTSTASNSLVFHRALSCERVSTWEIYVCQHPMCSTTYSV